MMETLPLRDWLEQTRKFRRSPMWTDADMREVLLRLQEIEAHALRCLIERLPMFDPDWDADKRDVWLSAVVKIAGAIRP